jgi:cytochrome c-type biogenesis protein CcmH/NrfG
VCRSRRAETYAQRLLLFAVGLLQGLLRNEIVDSNRAHQGSRLVTRRSGQYLQETI